MKKNLLFGFLAASALLGAAPLANAGVVLEEDFNQFTDGTTSKPGNVDIAASGKLGDVLLGWTGEYPHHIACEIVDRVRQHDQHQGRRHEIEFPLFRGRRMA